MCWMKRQGTVWVGTRKLITLINIQEMRPMSSIDAHNGMIYHVLPVGDTVWSCGPIKICVWNARVISYQSVVQLYHNIYIVLALISVV